MSDAPHGDVRFEPTDVAPGGVVTFLAGLFGAMVTFMVLLWYAQSFLLRHESAEKKPTNVLAATGHEQLPPEPRVEGVGLDAATHSVNRTDLPNSAAVLRAEQEKKLRDGWTDTAGGKHPPIDEAIRRLVAQHQKGKP